LRGFAEVPRIGVLGSSDAGSCIGPVLCRRAFLCTYREASWRGVHKKPIIPHWGIAVSLAVLADRTGAKIRGRCALPLNGYVRLL
jgi:hypothetical protein